VLLTLLAVCVTLAVALPAQALGPTWTGSTQVATGAAYPATALDGKGNVHLVWVDGVDGSLRHQILGRPATRVPSPAARNYFPSLTADVLGRVHLVWDNGADVFYALWDGDSWDTPVALPRLAYSAFEAEVKADETGRPHVILWSSSPASGYVPCYTTQVDGKWQPLRCLPVFVPSSTRLSFCVAEGQVRVAFLYQRSGGIRSVGYTSTGNGGLTWTPLEDVAGERAPVLTSRPSVILQDSMPIVTWASQDAQTQQLCSWYARRAGGGWASPVRLVKSQGTQRDPVANWDGERLLVAWQQTCPGNGLEIAVTSTDPSTGASETPTVFAWRGIPTALTADATPDGEAIVVWATGNREIYYAYHPAYRPKSSVSPLPVMMVTCSFPVSWSGLDRSGTGIAYYDIQYRDGAGEWCDWLTHTGATTAVFQGGLNGHTYRFRSRAVDNAGVAEAWPASCDAVTSIFLNSEQVHLPLVIR
jgi:hypothetical protein